MHKSLLFILLLIISSTSWATNNIRPGLWKITTTSNLLAMMPHLPSQQMADQDVPAHFYESQTGCSVKNAIKTGNHNKEDLSGTSSISGSRRR